MADKGHRGAHDAVWRCSAGKCGENKTSFVVQNGIEPSGWHLISRVIAAL